VVLANFFNKVQRKRWVGRRIGRLGTKEGTIIGVNGTRGNHIVNKGIMIHERDGKFRVWQLVKGGVYGVTFSRNF
jgi:hypothetical protein